MRAVHAPHSPRLHAFCSGQREFFVLGIEQRHSRFDQHSARLAVDSDVDLDEVGAFSELAGSEC